MNKQNNSPFSILNSQFHKQNRATILLVEDDPDIMLANREALEMEGYRVLTADTLSAGREAMENENPDLIVLDITLPDGNGLEYCREIRGISGVRILFLSALNTREDSVAGIRAGGDDYLPKPYLIDELLARVEALMRRGKLIEMEEPPLRLGALTIDFTPRRALLCGEDLLLKPKEFALLEILARNRDRYTTAKELYEKAWGMDAAGDVRTVKVRVSSLRQKLGGGFDVESSRGEGYRLIEN